jgi:hypothetical protein
VLDPHPAPRQSLAPQLEVFWRDTERNMPGAPRPVGRKPVALLRARRAKHEQDLPFPHLEEDVAARFFRHERKLEHIAIERERRIEVISIDGGLDDAPDRLHHVMLLEGRQFLAILVDPARTWQELARNGSGTLNIAPGTIALQEGQESTLMG